MIPLYIPLLAALSGVTNAIPLNILQVNPTLSRECTGACTGYVHDPSVVWHAESKTYYRFATNNKITVATAPSIGGPWTDQGAALPNGSSVQLAGNQDLWAPDVFEIDGTYYMYYAVSEMSSSASDIGVATATKPDAGCWTDHGSIGIANGTTWNKIDPNLFQHDGNSPFLLSWGSFFDGIFQVEMNNPPLTIKSSAPVNHLAQNTTDAKYIEGGYQFQWNGLYWLFFSSGFCCNLPENLPKPGDEYKVMVCRSTSPTGGFVDQNGKDCVNDNGGTLVLASSGDNFYAPGGQGVLFDPNMNQVVMYYHYVNPQVSYDYSQFMFGWNVLDFSSGWPVAT